MFGDCCYDVKKIRKVFNIESTVIHHFKSLKEILEYVSLLSVRVSPSTEYVYLSVVFLSEVVYVETILPSLDVYFKYANIYSKMFLYIIPLLSKQRYSPLSDFQQPTSLSSIDESLSRVGTKSG